MAVNFKLQANADIVSKNISKYKTKLETSYPKRIITSWVSISYSYERTYSKRYRCK
jgi:hypothetical protein